LIQLKSSSVKWLILWLLIQQGKFILSEYFLFTNAACNENKGFYF
jgi:hypothetical protein